MWRILLFLIAAIVLFFCGAIISQFYQENRRLRDDVSQLKGRLNDQAKQLSESEKAAAKVRRNLRMINDRECLGCEGTGRCTWCFGERGSSCSICGGTGRCDDCGGSGRK